MGKQATPKAGGAIVKKQASWKTKPVMGQRKNEKKRGEIASAVDLRQPKEPDPLEAWIQQILGELEKIRTTGLPLYHVAQVASLRSDSLEVGNALFHQWHESFPRLLNQDCETFDAPFLDVHGKVSIEGRIEHLFEEHEGTTESIVRHIAAFDCSTHRTLVWLDFLDGFGDDPMDVFDGTLTIDMMIANSKDIDDGATVAGAMEDLRKTEEQLQEAFTEIEVQGQRLEATSVQLAEKES